MTKVTLRNSDLRQVGNCKELKAATASSVIEIDLSFNKIDSANGLDPFTNCSTLILDNNSFSSLKTLPHLASLMVMSLSNNSLRDCDNSLAQICVCAPKIQHLNLIGNPMNPMFSNPAKYEDFRAKVKIWLPTLETLDGTNFTQDQSKIAILKVSMEAAKAKALAKIPQ